MKEPARIRLALHAVHRELDALTEALKNELRAVAASLYPVEASQPGHAPEALS